MVRDQKKKDNENKSEDVEKKQSEGTRKREIKHERGPNYWMGGISPSGTLWPEP